MKKTICVLLICALLCGCADLPGERYVNPTVTTAPETTAPESTPSEATVPATTAPPAAVPAVSRQTAAEQYVDIMPLEQQVAQMFLIRCPESEVNTLISECQPGGLILFNRDTARQTPESLTETLRSYQNHSTTPLIIAVDEEGGSVTRISNRTAFRESRFLSPRKAFWQGGDELVLEQEAEKAQLLTSLGINVNLAPVCDVVTDESAIMADRSLQLDADYTGKLIAEMVETMTQNGIGACLKHFPGYGNCGDTHTGTVVDERSLERFRESDFIPFRMGIEAGAGSVMVCHNIVTAMDASLPASLSPAVHQILREELKFDGVILTDDLAMEAITDVYGSGEAAVLAVLAGNDMLITTWTDVQYEAVLEAIDQGRISPERIRESAVRIIRWKMELGLM